MRKLIVLLLVVVLSVVGFFAGRFAAPLLARRHYAVRLADRLRLEAENSDLEPTLESNAFRATGKRPEELYAEADHVLHSFAIGGPILGVWCGLVLSLIVFGLHRERRREIWEIDYDHCVACGRCFRSCPRERLRLKEIGEEGNP